MPGLAFTPPPPRHRVVRYYGRSLEKGSAHTASTPAPGAYRRCAQGPIRPVEQVRKRAQPEKGRRAR